MPIPITSLPISTAPASPAAKDPELWRLAQSLEASFLTEMLGNAGLGKSLGDFGGGIGEQHFSNFLNKTHADSMVAKGGIGLAESIYRSLSIQGEAIVDRRAP